MGRERARSYLLLTDEALLGQCEVDHYRARGPGGQKRNKTSSAVRLRHLPTGLSASAEDDRSQKINKTRALRRLRRVMAMDLRTPIAVAAYRPSEQMRGAIFADGRIRIALRNNAYFVVVGEILDLCAACRMRVSEAAELLGVSTAQLVRFLQGDLHLWRRVNELRAAQGLNPLRSKG